MYLLNQFLFLIFFSALFFLCGASVLPALRLKTSISLASLVGFIVTMMLFFIIALPARFVGISLTGLMIASVTLFCILLGGAVFLFLKKRLYEAYRICIKNLFNRIKNAKLIYGFIVVLFLANVFSTCFCYWGTSDDSFYLPRTMEMIETDRLDVSESVAWLGYDLEGFPKSTDISTFEAFKAVCSKIFAVPVTILCRNSMSVILICLSFFSLWQFLGSALSSHKNAQDIRELSFVICFWVLIIAGAIKLYNDSLPFWQIRYIWQGKAVLYAVIYPFIYKICFDIYNTAKNGFLKWNHFVLLSFTLTAGISLTIIGSIFPAILCFILGLPYIIYCLIKKNFRGQTALQLIVALIPVLLCSFGEFIYIITKNSRYLSAFSVPNWLDTLKDMLYIPGKGFFWGLYAIALIYILFRGSLSQKMLFVAAPVLLFATFLNPLLIGSVSTYVTTGSVYWRLYLLLPMWYVPALVSATVICNLMINMRKIIVLALFAGGIFFVNQYKYVIVQRENNYSVPQNIISASEYISADYTDDDYPILYSLDGSAWEIRQYSADVNLLTGIRDSQRKINNIDEIPEISYNILCKQNVNNSQLEVVLKQCDVDYCCVYTYNIEYIQDCTCIEKMASIGFVTLFKVVNH